MANYRGYFRAFDRLDEENATGNLYSVHIGTFSASTYTEVLMAGDEPFVVRYETNATPFDPVRTSTATISIVHNSYLEDILPSKVKETPIYLYNETDRRTEWMGYLTPKEYSQNYTEEYETVQLEAVDCVSVLQQIDYIAQSGDNEKKGIVSLSSILGKICDDCGLLSGFYWTRSKYLGNTVALPGVFRISEQNFYSSDTDEPWTQYDILSEICRYFGFTAMQWNGALVLCDYRYMASNSDIYATWYSKSSGYAQGSATHIGGSFTANQEAVRSANASISFEPIFNKIVVKDNMYSAESIIPKIFDDEYLTNRIDPDNFYEAYVVSIPSEHVPTYPWGSKWYTLWHDQYYKKDQIVRDEGTDSERKSTDNDYKYYHRPYTHKYWKSRYNQVLSDGTGRQSDLAVPGGTILDQGVVRNRYISQYGQYITPSKLDYTRYVCISQQNVGTTPVEIADAGWQIADQVYYPVLSLTGYTNTCPITSNSFLVLNCRAIFEKYSDRPYINPDWLNEGVKIGGWNVHSSIWGDGFLNFRLKIGNKYWNGVRWGTTATMFSVALEDDDKGYGFINKERGVLNRIGYELGINEDGYLIPLSGVDPLGEISFDICLPSIQFWYDGENIYNGYCWLKDFDLKVVQAGQGEDFSEGDIVYENEVPSGDTFANSFQEITLKLTTMTEKTTPSYSNVMYVSGGTTYALETIREIGGSGAMKPEENIIEKYYNQYSTQTKKITMDLEYQGLTPMSKIIGIDVAEPESGFVILGTSIDYKYSKQTITCINLK